MIILEIFAFGNSIVKINILLQPLIANLNSTHTYLYVGIFECVCVYRLLSTTRKKRGNSLKLIPSLALIYTCAHVHTHTITNIFNAPMGVCVCLSTNLWYPVKANMQFPFRISHFASLYYYFLSLFVHFHIQVCECMCI